MRAERAWEQAFGERPTDHPPSTLAGGRRESCLMVGGGEALGGPASWSTDVDHASLETLWP
jgi:hypothetical protein